jgi:hypothetical protein
MVSECTPEYCLASVLPTNAGAGKRTQHEYHVTLQSFPSPLAVPQTVSPQRMLAQLRRRNMLLDPTALSLLRIPQALPSSRG